MKHWVKIKENEKKWLVLRLWQRTKKKKKSYGTCFVWYRGHSLVESYPSAENQLVYSTAPVDWANVSLGYFLYIFFFFFFFFL